MAKVQIKSEKLTPFGGIFSIMEQFDAAKLRLHFDIPKVTTTFLVHPYHLTINLKNYKKSLAVSIIQRIFATIIKERKAIWKQKTRRYKFIL